MLSRASALLDTLVGTTSTGAQPEVGESEQSETSPSEENAASTRNENPNALPMDVDDEDDDMMTMESIIANAAAAAAAASGFTINQPTVPSESSTSVGPVPNVGVTPSISNPTTDTQPTNQDSSQNTTDPPTQSPTNR